MGKFAIEYLSKNAYAKYLGVNEKAIRNAVTEGKIKKGWDADKQKIIKHLADKEYGFLHTTPKTGPGVSKAKVIEKLKSEKKHDKVSKTRTETKDSSDVEMQNPKSEKLTVAKLEILDRQPKDLSRLDTAELLRLIVITADMDYKDALTANEIIEAALKKKKLEELEDILVRKANVENVLFSFGRQMRKGLMAIPARVIDDIMAAGSKTEAVNILNHELVATLDQYANFEGIRLSNKE